MGSPFIFAGNFAKALKSNLNLADQVYVLTGSLDPTVTPVDAPKASLYMRNTGTAAIWQKTDNGSSTNWNLITTNTITGLNAALIADGTVSNAEFQYINSLTSNAQDQLTANATAISNHLADTVDAHDASAISNIPAGNLAATDVQGALNELQSDVDGRQLADSDLTALAGLSSAGIIARTGAGTAAVRTLTSGSSKLSLTNGDGVSGNPTFDVSESNLTLDNIGGTLGYAKGGTGLTALGSANQLLRVNAGATALEYASVGSGDVVGPASATDNAIARFDGTTGKLVQNSDCSISDTGAVTLGPSTGAAHTINSNNGVATRFNSPAADGVNIEFFSDNTAPTRIHYNTSTISFRAGTLSSAIETGNATAAGAWTLGPSTGSGITHTLKNGVSGLFSYDGSSLKGFQNLNVATAGLRIIGQSNGNTTNAGNTQIDNGYIEIFQTTTNTLGGYIAFHTHDGTSVTEKGRITQAGAWTLGQTSSTATNCIVNGAASVTHGVVFPSTPNLVANANTLDDFEEGTFTPQLKFGGNSVGMVNGSVFGFYQKIGSRVHFNMVFEYTTKGSSTGAPTITGLPFTSAGTSSGGNTAVAISCSGFSALNNSVAARIVGGAAEIEFRLISIAADASADSTPNSGQFASTFLVRAAGLYVTAS